MSSPDAALDERMCRAREIVDAFVTRYFVAKYGGLSAPDALASLRAPSYADVDIHPGDLYRLTGFGPEIGS